MSRHAFREDPECGILFSMEDPTSTLPNADEPRTAAPAVAKAARVLDAVASPGGGASISEIARRAELSKSTAHGVVSALVDAGFLVASSESRGFELGPHLVELGLRARDLQLLDVAQEALRELVHRSGETSLFGRLKGTEVTILAHRESHRSVNLSAAVGSAVPLMAGALGKAYLALFTQEEATTFLQRTLLPRYTEKTVTDVEYYLREVDAARTSGYALDRGEYLPGVSAVSTAFLWLGSTYFMWTIQIEGTHQRAEFELIVEALKDSKAQVLGELHARSRP